MKVNFNNVRKRQVLAYKKLVAILNDHVDRDGLLVISRDDICEPMGELKETVATIALCYSDGDPDMADVLGDETLPDIHTEQGAEGG